MSARTRSATTAPAIRDANVDLTVSERDVIDDQLVYLRGHVRLLECLGGNGDAVGGLPVGSHNEDFTALRTLVDGMREALDEIDRTFDMADERFGAAEKGGA